MRRVSMCLARIFDRDAVRPRSRARRLRASCQVLHPIQRHYRLWGCPMFVGHSSPNSRFLEPRPGAEPAPCARQCRRCPEARRSELGDVTSHHLRGFGMATHRSPTDIANTRLRIGLFGIGLDTYWPQFDGLRERLVGYQDQIAERLRDFGVELDRCRADGQSRQGPRGGVAVPARGRRADLPLHLDLRLVVHRAAGGPGSACPARGAEPSAGGRNWTTRPLTASATGANDRPVAGALPGLLRARDRLRASTAPRLPIIWSPAPAR